MSRVFKLLAAHPGTIQWTDNSGGARAHPGNVATHGAGARVGPAGVGRPVYRNKFRSEKKLSRKRATCTLHVARFQSLQIYPGLGIRAEASVTQARV
jgi:hypothetical protein